MRLKHIKLAGFKSFVDPTKVPFVHQMTAIVGPNGCGKSNIIDAIKWVLGESSAKNLRGDAMTDVIFNGSTHRKAVGQASVELVFENLAGHLKESLAGNIAERSEMSIRRLVTLDGISQYFLNGSKCRRKDITDIFLGTGLGPRSYAIIEQGTVTRLIESKPQELRTFLEEAAGISKYKERRRDAENRIRHTKENLARLTDIRLELSDQIEKLHQQSVAAQRFKTLKAKERQFKAELAVLKWQQFERKAEQQNKQMQAFQQSIESLVVEQQVEAAQLLQAKQNLTLANEKFNQLQQQKLTLTTDITRVEQQLKFNKQQQQQVEQMLVQTEQASEQNQVQFESEQTKLVELKAAMAQQEPSTELLVEQLAQYQIALEQEQTSLQHEQQSLYQTNQMLAEQSALSTKIQTGLNVSQQQVEQLTEQIVQIDQALTQVTTLEIKESEILAEQLELLIVALEDKGQSYRTLEQQFTQAQKNEQEVKKTLQQYCNQHHALKTNVEQLTRTLNRESDWLKRQTQALQETHQTTKNYQQLFQTLDVESGWEDCVELVLAAWLQAHVIKEQVILPIEQQITLLETNDDILAISGTLAEKVSGNGQVTLWLNKILVADNEQHALVMLSELTEEQSVICQSGVWLSSQFIKRGNLEASDEFLFKQNQLSELTRQINTIEQKIIEVEQQEQASEVIVTRLKQQLEEQALQVKEHELQISEKRQALALQQQKEGLQEQQYVDLKQQQNVLQVKLAEQQEQLSNWQVQQQEQPNQDLSEQLTVSHQKIESLSDNISHYQVKIQQLHQQKYQQAVAIEQDKSKEKILEQSLERLLSQKLDLRDKLQTLNEQKGVATAPMVEDQQKLQTWLEQVSSVEQSLKEVQENVVKDQQQIDLLEGQKQEHSKKLEQLKEQVNHHHLEAESYKVRANSIIEPLHEQQLSVKTILAGIPTHAKETTWQAQLNKLSRDISQLGAINLAAIDEYESQLTRKNFLDQQDHDLTQAISTLESVIAKIDKESRDKFKLTFEQVNQGLKQLFPKVFGGGSAYLALTDDDMLETGVTIMARPPGKKNSTIHLLSGGEKALTALSLVFAIFRLNPAPFCMLDEVDAPLDDANVGRFCNLVREMSQTVQFIYISHNKIAMEMASHLTGVTMFEPGVSRLVAVDIDEALTMAELN